MNGIPDRIGRYKVERLLGQGAMGSVYLGRDPDLDRAVAIKTVRDLDLEEDRLLIFLERFRNEAKAAARLSHPAIVAVYDVGEDPEYGPYLVFEYVAGSTLKQIVRGKGPLAPAAVLLLARQIAAALDTAHAAGVIHRDVKPDNILISGTGDAKLADFGIARVPDAALTKEGQFLGTPCYAAPETLEHGNYGSHSDCFSFAAVLYEAISGVRAFPGDDAISVAHAVVHDSPVPLSRAAPELDVPREIERVVMRGLEKDPDRRYGSAMELVDALASAYIETGTLDRDPTGAQVLPIPEPARERRGGGWVFGLVVAGLAIVGVVFVVLFVDLGSLTNAGANLSITPDAGLGVADAGLEAVIAYTDDASAVIADAGVDAGTDAGAPIPDGLPDVSGMSAFERDEAAKDAIDDARDALGRGDLDAATEALRRARAYDPGNSDIAELEAQLRATTGS